MSSFQPGLASRQELIGTSVGFVLIDANLNPVAANSEAIQILAYPGKPETVRGLAALLAGMIRVSLIAPRGQHPPFVSEFKSGKRRYLCRTFLMDGHGECPLESSVALLLERNLSDRNGLYRIADQFQLTPRQRRAVELLLYGLTNKEIADRMAISLNTVKFLFHLVMLKLKVTSRVEIIAKVIAGETA